MPRLSGRIAAITGGADGIGAAVALRFAQEGAVVAILDRDGKGAKAIADAITRTGGTALGLELDVTDWEAVQVQFGRITEWQGPTTVLVNCAGIIRPAMFSNLEPDAWRAVLDVHLTGAYHCCRAVVDTLPTDGTGRIINVTSAAGLTGTIGQANYGAAKAGVIGLTKSLAKELGRKSITVNAIAPVADTKMMENIRNNEKLRAMQIERILLRRVAEPEEVTGAFVFMASDDASYVTGQVLCVDGGAVT